MPKLTSLQVLLEQEIKDLYSAENQLLKALPKMARAANEQTLQEAFQNHEKETQIQVERLEKVAELLEITPRGKSCKAMKGLVEEGEEAIGEDGEMPLTDLALITAAQKAEHYEISGYGSARALAEALGLTDIVDLLQATLDEEASTDKTLTQIAKTLLSSTLPSDS